MAKLKKRFRILEADLSRSKDDGQLFHDGPARFTVRIHRGHSSERERIDTIVHEALHIGDLRMPERKVRHLAAVITDALWRQGYRRSSQKGNATAGSNTTGGVAMRRRS